MGRRSSVGLVALLVSAFASPTSAQPGAGQAASPTGPAPLSAEVGEFTFHFTPQQYPFAQANSKVVILWYFWPGMEPHTKQNDVEFNRLGWGNKVLLFFRATNEGRPIHDYLYDRFGILTKSEFRGVQYPIPLESDIAGYDKLEDPFGHWIYVSRSDRDFAISCVQPGGVPSPSCQHFGHPRPGLLLTYSFALTHIAAVDEIRRSVDDEVDRHLQKPSRR